MAPVASLSLAQSSVRSPPPSPSPGPSRQRMHVPSIQPALKTVSGMMNGRQGFPARSLPVINENALPGSSTSGILGMHSGNGVKVKEESVRRDFKAGLRERVLPAASVNAQDRMPLGDAAARYNLGFLHADNMELRSFREEVRYSSPD